MKRNLHLIGKRMGFGVRCLFFYFFLRFFDKSRDCSFFCLAIVRPLRKG